MNYKMSKRQKDLKSKLMAAICMLLVSSIMMVSTTYAWFTLSTAPEVTGISTSVGANGNLEIALLPETGDVNAITSQAGDSNKTAAEKNVTWGNLVDLSDTNTYGLDKINLYPSALNKGTDGKVSMAAPLKFPTYGADGRVDELVANTSTGIYNDGSFAPDGLYGVRAVGSASGMTERQLSYRNARATAQSAMSYAAQLAGQSLNTNGNALANIAIKKGTEVNEFDQTDVNALQSIITDLTKEDGVLDQIDTAYMQYLLALAASKTAGSDEAWLGVKSLVEANGATLASVKAGLASYGISLDAFADLNNGITKYEAILEAVDNAQDNLDALNTDDTKYEWNEIQDVLTALANPSYMKVNGYLASEIKQNMNGLINSALGGAGVVVTLDSGAGVYADIADQTEDFRANINIDQVSYGGATFGPLPAKMNTNGKTPSYLSAVGTAVAAAQAPDGGEAGSVPITDMYGYIVDMAFRTNAASSNLLLQVAPKDRIYEDNANGVEVENNGESVSTMGNGANMTFTSTNTAFTNDMMTKMMQAIRLVFFDASGNILKYGKLSTATTGTADGGLKADIVLCDATDASTATVYFTKTEQGNPTYTVYCTDDTLQTPFCRSYNEEVQGVDGEGQATTTTVTKWQLYTPGTDGAEGTWGEATETQPSGIPSETVKTEAGLAPCADQKIMVLNQNAPTRLSVMVYLDGENITNADVAANGSSSCTAELNLQFASDANLTPMEYTPLMNQGGSGSGSGSNTDTTNPTATLATGSAQGVSLSDVAYTAGAEGAAGTITFKLAGTDSAKTYTVSVGGNALTAADGVYTVANVTANVEVLVTENT